MDQTADALARRHSGNAGGAFGVDCVESLPAALKQDTDEIDNGI